MFGGTKKMKIKCENIKEDGFEIGNLEIECDVEEVQILFGKPSLNLGLMIQDMVKLPEKKKSAGRPKGSKNKKASAKALRKKTKK